jgi:hypothetical protein
MIQRFNGRRLTAAQFAVAVRGLRMTSRNQELAWAAMVEGVPMSELVASSKLTRGAIDRTVRRVYEAHLERRDMPPEWREVRLTVPSSMADRFEAQAAAVIAEHDFARRLAATAAAAAAVREEETAEAGESPMEARRVRLRR